MTVEITAESAAATQTAEKRVVFVDIDGTLVNSDVITYWRYFAVKALPRALYLARLIILYSLSPYYIWLDKRDRAAFNVAFYRYYAGLPMLKLLRAAQPCYEEVTSRHLNAALVARLVEHQRQGDHIVLLTGGLDLAAEPLARSLGVTDVISPRLEFRNGRATGKLTGPPVIGGEKAARARRFALQHGFSLSSARAYADSFSDLPLLEAVGHPVPVDPDRRLREVALARAWPIFAEKPA